MASDDPQFDLRDLIHDLKNGLTAVDIHLHLAQQSEGDALARCLSDARQAINDAKDQLDALRKRPATAPRPARFPPPSSGPALKVLIMDDDPRIRRTMTRLLAHLGHEAMGVAEGSQAVQAYREAMVEASPFDLILLDLVVPGAMDGVATLEAIKELDPKARALVCSGYDDRPVLNAPRDHGFVGALLKPFEPDELQAIIAEAMDIHP